MANIFKTTAILSNLTDAPISVFTTEEMEVMISNYWGSAAAERTFPIPFWKLEQLFAASTGDEVVFCVTNIDNPAQADATWTATPESDTEAVYQFILNKTYFSGPIELPGTPPASLSGISTTVSNVQSGLIIGRLGKDDEGGYHAFFKAAEYQMVNEISARVDSGDGSTSGVKIP
jgi:hypothetical protein